MITAMLLAAAPAHCADPGFCPTVAELRLAILRDEDKDTGILIDDQNPVRQVTDVFCERPDRDENTVTCKATFHYRTGRSFLIVRLSRGAQQWQVEQRLEVFQKR